MLVTFQNDGLTFLKLSELISMKAGLLFNDTTPEFCEMSEILERFDDWKRHDFTTYKDTYFNLCLPKVNAFIFIVLYEEFV